VIDSARALKVVEEELEKAAIRLVFP